MCSSDLSRRPAEPASLPLFEAPPAPPAEHPLAAELRDLAPERMTPLEALQRLMEWKQRYDG